MRTLALLLILLTSCVGRGPVPELGPRFPSPLHRTYVPISRVQRCLASVEAETFAAMLIADGLQERGSLVCHPALVQAAWVRGMSMARYGYFGHTDPWGVTPNEVAEKAGCRQPWGKGNYIESIAAGAPITVLYWNLRNSPDHAAHMFGQGDFFRGQKDFGIAFVEWPGSSYTYYVVVLIGTCLQ